MDEKIENLQCKDFGNKNNDSENLDNFDELYDEIIDKYKNKQYKPKKDFFYRIAALLKNKKDIMLFFDKCYTPMFFSVRTNTIKISIEELKKRLEEKWEIEWQKKYGIEEAFVIKSKLDAGELGKAIEHRLGYYYVQSLSSMLPSKILMQEILQEIKKREKKEKKEIKVLDCCAAPGSKTTHIAALLNNNGLILANDISWHRNIALLTNLQRCGVTNTVVTSLPIQKLVKKLEGKIKFTHILVDAPCSNEGTIRKNPNIFKIWNRKMGKRLSNQQKSILANALRLLDTESFLVYSTCTFNPEENEEVIDYVLERFPIKLEKIKLKIKTRKGITKWGEKEFNKELKKAIRIWPMDFDSEGFFIAKIKMEK